MSLDEFIDCITEGKGKKIKEELKRLEKEDANKTINTKD